MPEATFTFRVEDSLKEAFVEAAKAQDRSGAQLLREYMRDTVRRQRETAEHDNWFRAEVEQGLREADNPDVRRVPHEEVMGKMSARLEARIAQAGKRAG